MKYRAKAAYPYINRDRAVSGLRGQLRALAGAEGGTPDWSARRVSGPDQAIGVHGVTWYEWTAEVDGQCEVAGFL
jgi:hypothetical protein